MTVVTGQAQVSDLASVQRAIALDKDILLLEPSAAPLTVITKRMENGGNVRATEDPTFSWVEDERDVRFDAVNNGAGYEAAATEFKVDTPEVFYKAALVRVPRTGEILYVKKVEGEKIEITRGFAGTSAAAVVDNDPLFVIGIVAEEGDRSFEARRTAPTKISNNTEITRTSIEESGTAMSSGNLTNPHAWIHEHRKRMIEHLVSIEHKGLFGSKGETTGPNGGTLRTTGGLLSFYTQNSQDMGGTMTEAELESWVSTITRYGSRQKVVFLSRKAASVISQFAVGKLQTVQSDNDTTYGLAITKYQTVHGELNLVVHDLLEGAVWGGYMIAVDMKGPNAPEYRPLGGQNAPGGSRDTRLLKNRQESDRDGQRDEILTEAGFAFKQVKTGGVATGITG